MLALIVAQTAALRWSARSDGLRRLLQERGRDPARCIQVSCEQGDDVNIVLVLDDGTAVDLDFREHYQTRQAIRFTRYDLNVHGEPRIECARQIQRAGGHDFDAAVRSYYEKVIARCDDPLPAMKWGDQSWHLWEKRPEG